MNKQLIKQNLEELKKQTLLSILSAKGVIWTYYEKKLCRRDTHSSLETFLGIKGRAEKQQKGRNKMSKEYIVKGTYTYKVQRIIKADNKVNALEEANDVEPLCEWDSQDQDTYSEIVTSIEERK